MKQLNTLNMTRFLPKGFEVVAVGQSKIYYFKGVPSLLLVYGASADPDVRVFENPKHLQDWLNDFLRLQTASSVRPVKKGDVYSLYLGDDVAYCVVDQVMDSGKVTVKFLNRWRNYTDTHEFMCFPIVGSYLKMDDMNEHIGQLNGDLLQLDNVQAGCFFEYMEPFYIDDKDFKNLRVYPPQKYKVCLGYSQ